IRAQARVDALETGASGVTVTVRGEGAPLRARAAVLACGANYRFNRQLGLGVPRAYVQTAQVDVPFPARPHIEVHFGREVAPSGFAWTVPSMRDGQPAARLGLLCDGSAALRFSRYAARVGAEAGLGPITAAPRLKMLPLGPVRKTVADRLVAVGDAAGM